MWLVGEREAMNIRDDGDIFDRKPGYLILWAGIIALAFWYGSVFN